MAVAARHSDGHSVEQDQILCNYQHGWTGCIPLLAVRNMPLSPLTCPCVLELGHRLSLVAVVRSADQRLAIAIIQEQTVAKKDPGTETGESCWLASKARLARNQGVLTQPRRFTEGE